jgi:hypothetical protein
MLFEVLEPQCTQKEAVAYTTRQLLGSLSEPPQYKKQGSEEDGRDKYTAGSQAVFLT